MLLLLFSMDLAGLSFDDGLGNEAVIRKKIGSSVTHSVFDRASFFLVASFGRCKFRLSEDSVSKLLQAAIGGNAQHFFLFLSSMTEPSDLLFLLRK